MNMSTYTIKKAKVEGLKANEERLLLLNEHGEEVSALEILNSSTRSLSAKHTTAHVGLAEHQQREHPQQ